MPTKWIKAGSGGSDPPERLKLLQVIVIKAMRPDRQLYALEVCSHTVYTFLLRAPRPIWHSIPKSHSNVNNLICSFLFSCSLQPCLEKTSTGET